jgi:hypothetical protein
LDDCLEVQHLLDVAGHELAYFIDDEDEAPTGAAPVQELLTPFGKHPRSDVRSPFGGFDP